VARRSPDRALRTLAAAFTVEAVPDPPNGASTSRSLVRRRPPARQASQPPAHLCRCDLRDRGHHQRAYLFVRTSALRAAEPGSARPRRALRIAWDVWRPPRTDAFGRFVAGCPPLDDRPVELATGSRGSGVLCDPYAVAVARRSPISVASRDLARSVLAIAASAVSFARGSRASPTAPASWYRRTPHRARHLVARECGPHAPQLGERGLAGAPGRSLHYRVHLLPESLVRRATTVASEHGGCLFNAFSTSFGEYLLPARVCRHRPAFRTEQCPRRQSPPRPLSSGQTEYAHAFDQPGTSLPSSSSLCKPSGSARCFASRPTSRRRASPNVPSSRSRRCADPCRTSGAPSLPGAHQPALAAVSDAPNPSCTTVVGSKRASRLQRRRQDRILPSRRR